MCRVVVGMSDVPEPASVELRIEPYPTSHEFEPIQYCDFDATAHSVEHALELLRWDSADPLVPLLVVHPTYYGAALDIAVSLNRKLAVWAMPFSENIDTWYVAWRGRRVGSKGA